MTQYLHGDCRYILQTLPEKSVHCVVTSPPYWGLRDYGIDGQIGLEITPEDHLKTMVEIFREVWRVLRPDGTVWMNYGDSYWNGGGEKRNNGHTYVNGGKVKLAKASGSLMQKKSSTTWNLKPKDMIGMPWRVAFSLQEDGWYLRSDIIWHKPNVMPESVIDRPTKAHEYIFLLAKSERYYYDHSAIAEQVVAQEKRDGVHKTQQPIVDEGLSTGKRNKRSVWSVPTQPYTGAHFAVFPPELIRPCILAGCPFGGTVLDPFGGSGTTALVAEQEGRNAILIELNQTYIELQKQRTQQTSILSALIPTLS